ncbi:MAG: SUMF1/EgtB/PvdO family nonheme iron enzyme [Planctomycetota bacterium]|nr:SUMF1/EgtB/PvdO family nonheme iron enzyme [Planctomycetota bacterium]
MRVPCRREVIKTMAAVGGSVLLPGSPALRAAAPKVNFNENIIRAPKDPKEWNDFRETLEKWRADERDRLHYDDALYNRPEFAWVSSCYACCFVMMCDRMFYSPQQAKYTIESFLDHGVREFGGYDAIVLWHAYPRIGLDDRNQFDFYRDMPGGLDGLKKLSQTCHGRGVKVFIDYNPWDTGTGRETVSDLDALAATVRDIDADGIFLDTMDKGAADFRKKLDAARPGVVLEGEGALPLQDIHDHHMSWAQWFPDSEVPGVLRNKWFERRHMQHQIKRWDRDHSGELHVAWMNGSGMMVWENVFGTWVGWSERDRSILRSMLPIQRRFTEVFTEGRWTPLVETMVPNVYASQWDYNCWRLWTLINRSDKRVEGDLLKDGIWKDSPVCDLVSGREGRASKSGVLSGSIPPRGIAAFLGDLSGMRRNEVRPFLESQRNLNQRAANSTMFPALSTKLIPVTPTRKYPRTQIPPGMAEIAPAAFNMKTEFRVRECGFYESQANISGLHKPITFERNVKLSRFAIDQTLVTNAQFAEFLKSTNYHPRHPENFLKHWKSNSIPPGLEDHPVVYVDLDDARAYAKWAGKRLPTEEEWQYAAQGPDTLKYPWGSEMKPAMCNDGSTRATTPVKVFPAGRSPFGLYDMCSNVWQLTESERSDPRTRFCIIRGGSYYQAKGSDWYMDGGARPCSFAAKFLLTWAGLDRCATIGFRCVADVDE